MAQPKVKLYQRLRTPGFPWIGFETAKNGNPKARPEAFQSGVRFTRGGKRRLDTAATLDEAVAILRGRSVRLFANQNGVVLPDATVKRSESKTKIADSITEYLTTGKAYEKKWSKDTLHCYRDSTRLFLEYCKAECVEHIREIDKKALRSIRRCGDSCSPSIYLD
jgi:hypothetical protein